MAVSNFDPCLFLTFLAKVLIVFIYIHVVDYLCSTSSAAWKTSFFAAFNAKWSCVDGGLMMEMLGMKMTFTDTGMIRDCRMSQARLILRMLGRQGMVECTPCVTAMKPKLMLLLTDMQQL
ncbi:hypothetical protein CYMTET_38406 [Cymbomonas tetramitiformis]|uniref:Uncharacterized protein n=1 Tax=Cymbomonas tetramitiformis TaxID=36881 RepID=A0AAE0CDJ3_9CHLO|nr:hypothetical protein CYMTET_38406 [Cymbomonas tetramitiformis]